MIPENSLTSEAGETSAAVTWIGMQQNAALKMTFHPASEAKRSVAMGASLKMQGMLPGIPDLVNPAIPFFLEMKAKRNVPSRYQAWWLINAIKYNILCGVAYNAEEAIAFFEGCIRFDVKNTLAHRRLLLMIEDWRKTEYSIDPWQSRSFAARRGR
jgi:hypothetical protein